MNMKKKDSIQTILHYISENLTTDLILWGGRILMDIMSSDFMVLLIWEHHIDDICDKVDELKNDINEEKLSKYELNDPNPNLFNQKLPV